MIKGFEPRLYQQTILATASQKNTLVVIPTGLGKTNIAVLLAAQRMKNYSGSKILILAPTKPLCDQHVTSLKKFLSIDEEKVQLFTGMISPAKRKELWKQAQIIVSTPQGMENDIIGGKISFKDVSLLVVDEAHRAVGDYAYVFITKQYNKRSAHPRVLALTASPGSDKEKIKEVCKNLFIEEIEVRSYDDPDVKPYVQEIDVEKVYVDLTEEMIKVKAYLEDGFNSKLEKIREWGYLYGKSKNYSKLSLLELQRGMFAKMNSGEKDFNMLKSLSVLAEALKLQHSLMLIETQGLSSLNEYFTKLEEESRTTKVKAVQNLVRDLNFRSAVVKTRSLLGKGEEHPKISKLREIVSQELREKKDVKIIIFNQFRDSSTKIKSVLDEIGVSSEIFVGQTKKKNTGLTQKRQKEIIDSFRNGKFNCLIATSVAEEGLDIPQVDLVIFYEPVPSAIRTVQRRGRTGRQEKGRVIMLVTKKTRDESNLWSAFHKEKRMYKILHSMKGEYSSQNFSQTTLNDSIRGAEDLSHIKIIADYREKASQIIRSLSDQGISVNLSQLEVGDFLLSDRVVVEYKKVKDFVDSIVDGRLLSQLKSLKRYERPIIIIEGEEDIYSQRKLHPNAIRGLLSTIAISYGIPIIQTKNSAETAALFLVISKREHNVEKKEYSLHSAKPLTLKEQQEYVVSSLPGIGPTIAKPLLKRFGSIKKIFNAEEKELKEVSLIGEKKAKQIRKVLDEEY